MSIMMVSIMMVSIMMVSVKFVDIVRLTSTMINELNISVKIATFSMAIGVETITRVIRVGTMFVNINWDVSYS